MDGFSLILSLLGIVILVLVIVVLSVCLYYLLRLGKNFEYIMELLSLYGKIKTYSVTVVESLDPRVVEIAKKVFAVLFPRLTDRRKSS